MKERIDGPAVSVIVLTYNQATTAEASVMSVLGSRDVEYEVVISDDSSTDGTRELLESIAGRYPDRVRLLPRHPNLGIPANYFYALEHCRGRYVTDVAGDDRRCDPSALSRHADMLDSAPELVAVSSRWRDGGSVNGTDVSQAPRRDTMTSLLALERPTPMMLSAMMYRRSIIVKLLRDNPGVVCDTRFRCEDLPVMLALLAAGDVTFDPAVTVDYAPAPDSITRTADPERRALFAAGLCHAVHHLSQTYGLRNEPRVVSALEDMAGYMLGCAAASGRPAAATAAVDAVKESGARLTLKGKVYEKMLRNRVGLRSIAWLKRHI